MGPTCRPEPCAGRGATDHEKGNPSELLRLVTWILSLATLYSHKSEEKESGSCVDLIVASNSCCSN